MSSQFERHWPAASVSSVVGQPQEMTSVDPKQSARVSEQSASSGFTLVEALVVAAVIGILASLLVPLLAVGKQKAQRTKCLSNLRELGVATRSHLDERGSWPTHMIHLEPYSQPQSEQDRNERTSPLWRCPSWKLSDFDPPGRFSDWSLNTKGSGLDSTFGHLLGLAKMDNAAMTGRPEPDVVIPADMITIAEMAEVEVHATPVHPLWTNIPFTTSTSYALQFRHQQKANSLFADGHTESAGHQNLIGPAEAVRRRWNHDNLPHDGNWR